MKIVNAYSLGALSTIFSSTQALTGNDLVTLSEDQTSGLIWNSDKSLCLKLSGNVYKDGLSNSPANPGKRIRKWNTCEGVSASFSTDCVDMMNSGLKEDDIPKLYKEYRFRISEHPDLDDRFCIINDCDDGLDQGGVYKLQWVGKQKGGKFRLKSFGGPSLDGPDEYFHFDDDSLLTYGSLSKDDFQPVVWREDKGNSWYVKSSKKVDRYNLFPEDTCKTGIQYPDRLPLTTASYLLSDFNGGDQFGVKTASFSMSYADNHGFPYNRGSYGSLTIVEDDSPYGAGNDLTTTLQYQKNSSSGPYRWFGFFDERFQSDTMKISFNYKWVDIPEEYKENGHLGNMRRNECGLKVYGKIFNEWFENADCFDSWCRFEQEFNSEWASDYFIILIFDQCQIDLKLRINDWTVEYVL